MPKSVEFHHIFPIISFGEHLSNLAELLELQVKLGMSIGGATFHSPSRETLKYLTGPFSSYDQHERLLWEELPLHSVRRLAVNTVFPPIRSTSADWAIAGPEVPGRLGIRG